LPIRSMTGYGASAFSLGGRRYDLDVRSVNHRFLDLKLFLPRCCDPLEPEVSRLVRDRIGRGHVEITARPVGADLGGGLAVTPDLGAARAVYDALAQVRGSLGLHDPITLEMVAGFREIFTFAEPRAPADELRGELLGALDRALLALLAMRDKEGAALADDILGRAQSARALAAEIEARGPEAVAARQRRLEARLRGLLADLARGGLSAEAIEARVAAEVALMADRVDVAEEVARLRSHLDQLEAMIREGGPQGRRLDFLAQELNREANTIGSKCQDSELSRRVVELKAEIERLREQVQNVE
jgi:uncharacterized protein (TIGR00255 family)